MYTFLDSVYATLMDFEAGGGNDTPESVNKALYDAVKEQAGEAGLEYADGPAY